MKRSTLVLLASTALVSQFGSEAQAGTGTITVLDSTGATKTYAVTTNGSSQFISNMVICDQSAAANCAGVDSGHSLQIAGEGTAGTPAGGVVTIQGAASMTAVQVQGSVTANQGGTWNITNISGTVSLPTGAATAAKQPALGTGGTPSTDVLTIQGISTMSPLQVTSSTASNFNATVVQATGTNLHVVCDSGCSGSGGTSSAFGSAFPANGTAIGLTNGTNMVAWSATTNYGTAPSTIAVPAVNAFVTNTNANGQTTMSGGSPVTLASDQSPLAVAAVVATVLPTLTGASSSQIRQTTAGQTLVALYSGKEFNTQGAVSASVTTVVSIIASVASGKNYITGIQCARTDAGTTAIVLTWSSSTIPPMVLPNNGGGGGNNFQFLTPVTTGALGLSYTSSAGVAQIVCGAQGYTGA